MKPYIVGIILGLGISYAIGSSVANAYGPTEVALQYSLQNIANEIRQLRTTIERCK